MFRSREYIAIAGYNPDPPDKPPLHIITIYFLGFTLKNVETPCLKVARHYVDMMTNTVLDTKEKFVELLTHDAFIIQISKHWKGAVRYGLETRVVSPIQSLYHMKFIKRYLCLWEIFSRDSFLWGFYDLLRKNGKC